MVRDPAQAEEVTQEAFLEIWRTPARFDAARGQRRRLAADDRPPQGRRPGPLGRGRPRRATRRTTSENQPVDHDQTAEAAHASLDAARVRGAAALTDVQREAVELAYFGGYTHTEVATMLDVPLGTAKTRIRDGLIRLRDLMGVAS